MNTEKTPALSKSNIRDAAKLARANMPNRDSASLEIARRMIHSREFFASKTIGCYLSTRDEVDTSSIILRSWRAKKRIFAPVTSSGGTMQFREIRPDSQLARNSFGLWEPVSGEFISPKELDVVVTPLVAFDSQCNRIGMGGGYFDRCFAFLKHRSSWLHPKLLGVAFSCQKFEGIAPNPYDVPLSRVITELD